MPILEDSKSFTPFVFYSSFIKKVAEFYRKYSINEQITFKLIEESDSVSLASASEYFIDPISIPLILSLCEQLSKFHKQPLQLLLYNNHGTENVLNFLAKSDFFDLAGSRQHSSLGKDIFNFDYRYLENYKHKNLRPEHKVRSYSLSHDNLFNNINVIIGDENQRDFLIEHYTYKVISHFEVLLYNNINTEKLHSLFIEILAELITNGVLHSKSDTFALMFCDNFKTKFSISDNGIGLRESMQKKENSFFYSKFELTTKLKKSNIKLNIPPSIYDNLYSIFETLYYSMLKSRKGLFDLMCNVVIHCSGYFRLHSENCQIIISNRMSNDLFLLYNLRVSILKIHNEYLYQIIDIEVYKSSLLNIKVELYKIFLRFYENTLSKYQNDLKFSSIRIYEVKFKGVHIEVEIPNQD